MLHVGISVQGREVGLNKRGYEMVIRWEGGVHPIRWVLPRGGISEKGDVVEGGKRGRDPSFSPALASHFPSSLPLLLQQMPPVG